MSDLLSEALREIAERPLAFAAELVQFAALVVIVWMLARRTVGKLLADRREKIAAQVARADHAADVRADAEKRAAALVDDARVQARAVGSDAEAAARRVQQEGLAAIAREAAAIVQQAEQALEAEKARAEREASEQLVGLIGVVARRFLAEAIPEHERRTLIHKLILEHLEVPSS